MEEEEEKEEAVLKCEQQVLLQAVTFKLRFCEKIKTFWNISHYICAAYICVYFKYVKLFSIWLSGSFKAELEKHLTFQLETT